LAVANSLAGVEAGARQVECTINGIGERAGNCSLEEVVMALRTRFDHFRLATSVKTSMLCEASRAVAQATGFLVQRNKAVLGEHGLNVRRPERTVATMDHSVPTVRLAVPDSEGRAQMAQLATNCADQRIELHAMGSEGQGIVHVIGPELGLTQPGATIVCG